MAAGTPAGSLSKASEVTAGGAHGSSSRRSICISMALEAERGVAFGEHLLIHRTVRIVADGAAFLDGVMGEYKGSGLSLVALGAGFILAVEVGAAAFEGAALVRVVTLGAAHLAGEHWVAVGHHELGFLIEVALEAGFRGFLRIDDGSRSAACGDVLAAGAVAGFAADVLGIGALGLELGVIRGAEVAGDLFMALRAGVGTDKGGTRNSWGSDNGLASGSTGNHDQTGGRGGSGDPDGLPLEGFEESFHV